VFWARTIGKTGTESKKSSRMHDMKRNLFEM
jgi:hypothetical protein